MGEEKNSGSFIDNQKIDNDEFDFQKMACLASSDVSEMLTNRLGKEKFPMSPVAYGGKLAKSTVNTYKTNKN